MQQLVHDQRDPAELTAAMPVMAPAGTGRGGARSMITTGRARPGRPAPAGQAQRQVVIIPAHGGAGASTLFTWLSPPEGRGWRVDVTPALFDADPAQMAAADWLRLPPPEVPLIIAARGNAEGARRAVIAVTTLEHRRIWPVAIALVADGAGPEPRQTAQYLDLIGDRAGPVVRVPFVAALRAGAGAATVRMRGSLYDAVADLLALALPEPARTRRPR
jgi:hypothetical protein